MSGYSDAHSHLADPRLDSPGDQLRRQLLQEARAAGILFHLQGGVGPEDWGRQRQLQVHYPEIGLCFGLHPYWVAEHSEAECEEGLNLLAQQQSSCAALGEMGLDLRPKILQDSFERQMSVFESQLELAIARNKPVVLHLVQAFPEAEKVFIMHGLPQKGGLVHSFNGDVHQARRYLEFGLMISVGGPALRAKNHRLHEAIKVVPLESLLLESDCPDQPGDPYRGGLNPPKSIVQVAELVAQFKGSTGPQVLEQASHNLHQLIGK